MSILVVDDQLDNRLLLEAVLWQGGYTDIVVAASAAAALALKEERDVRRSRERELLEAKKKLEESNRKLERLSATDALTGIANRRTLERFLEREWRRALRNGDRLTVIMVDVDHFTAYND